jgi:hypothetical protein
MWDFVRTSVIHLIGIDGRLEMMAGDWHAMG